MMIEMITHGQVADWETVQLCTMLSQHSFFIIYSAHGALVAAHADLHFHHGVLPFAALSSLVAVRRHSCSEACGILVSTRDQMGPSLQISFLKKMILAWWILNSGPAEVSVQHSA